MNITIKEYTGEIRLCTVCRRGEIQPSDGRLRAADEYSAKEGNMLVGNVETDCVIEIGGDALLVFDDDCVAAFTGAAFGITRTDEELERSRAIEIDEGDCVKITANGAGARLYIAVNGMIDELAASENGEITVKVTENGGTLDNMEIRVLEPFTPQKSVTLRVIPGPYSDAYDIRDLDLFYNGEYKVTGFDRGTVSFDGAHISPPEDLEYSVYSPAGLISFDRGGLPVIELAGGDRRTKRRGCAVVIEADMRELAQLSAGTCVRFSPCTVQIAQKLANKERRAFIGNYLLMND